MQVGIVSSKVLEIQKPIAVVENQDSAVTLQQSASVKLLKQISSVCILDQDALVDELVELNFQNVDVILSRHSDLEHIHSESEHQATISQIYWSLLRGLMSAYDKSEYIARELFQNIIYGLFCYANAHGVMLDPMNITEIALFLAPLSGDKALNVLRTVPESKWTERSHAIAYHLKWRQVPEELLDAEQLIENAAIEIDEEEANGDLEKLEHPETFKQLKSLLDCYISDNECQVLQSKLREKHWLSLRVRFEYVWKRIIDPNENTKQNRLPPKLYQMAATLIDAIIELSIYFEEYDYGWHWLEKTGIISELKLLAALMKCCRLAAQKNEKELWTGRAWVLYKQVLEMRCHVLRGNEDYITFMEQFSKLIADVEGEACLVTLPRLYSEMIPLCSPQHFPIPDSVIEPLIQKCWETRTEPRKKWGMAFEMIMSIYALFKHYKTKPNCQFKDVQYFSTSNFVWLLKLCTANGAIEEFKVLNRDITLSEDIDDDYVAKVKQGYTDFVTNKTRDIVPVKPIPRKTPKLDTASLLKFKELLIRLNK